MYNTNKLFTYGDSGANANSNSTYLMLTTAYQYSVFSIHLHLVIDVRRQSSVDTITLG